MWSTSAWHGNTPIVPNDMHEAMHTWISSHTNRKYPSGKEKRGPKPPSQKFSPGSQQNDYALIRSRRNSIHHWPPLPPKHTRARRRFLRRKRRFCFQITPKQKLSSSIKESFCLNHRKYFYEMCFDMYFAISNIVTSSFPSKIFFSLSSDLMFRLFSGF